MHRENPAQGKPVEDVLLDIVGLALQSVEFLRRLLQLVVAVIHETLYDVLQLAHHDHDAIHELAQKLEYLLLALFAHGIDRPLESGFSPEGAPNLL